MNIEIGKNIKVLRMQKGVTQEKLAAFLGVSAQAVSRWESGSSNPEVELIPLLAEYFGVTTDSLFWRDGKDKQFLNNAIVATTEFLYGRDITNSEKSLREKLATDPKNPTLLSLLCSILVVVLIEQKRELTQKQADELLAEGIALCSRLEEVTAETDIIMKCGIKSLKGALYISAGKTIDAICVSKELPSLRDSSEYKLLMAYREVEDCRRQAELSFNSIGILLLSFLTTTHNAEFEADVENKSKAVKQTRLKYNIRLLKIIDLLLEDDYLQEYKKTSFFCFHSACSVANAYILSGNVKKALQYVDIACDSAHSLDLIPLCDVAFNEFFIRRGLLQKSKKSAIFCFDGIEDNEVMTMPTVKILTDCFLNKSCFDEARQMPEFSAIIEKTKKISDEPNEFVSRIRSSLLKECDGCNKEKL